MKNKTKILCIAAGEIAAVILTLMIFGGAAAAQNSRAGAPQDIYHHTGYSDSLRGGAPHGAHSSDKGTHGAHRMPSAGRRQVR